VDKKESRSMPRQLEFEFMETLEPAKTYEYAVLVTTLEEEIRTVAQHYRDRADVENNFDELKNQWGWGGYTTHDLKRCQILARCIGLIYNWWSLFVRLAIRGGDHKSSASSAWGCQAESAWWSNHRYDYKYA